MKVYREDHTSFLFFATTQQISTEFGIESLHLKFVGSVYFLACIRPK